MLHAAAGGPATVVEGGQRKEEGHSRQGKGVQKHNGWCATHSLFEEGGSVGMGMERQRLVEDEAGSGLWPMVKALHA